jgi:hypothetical protein
MYGPKPRSSVPPPLIEEVELKKIHPGARSITLDFGKAFLQVWLLLSHHTKEYAYVIY